ncbi:hypothetical protein BH24ACT5_BH24ACT5_15180 [soil metagenome]
MAWLVSDARVLASAEVARTTSERRRGLRGRERVEGAYVLPSCRWVHSFGMQFPLDVAFVDPDSVVIKIARLRRWRLGMPVRQAEWIIEAPVGAFERWGLTVGDVVELRDADE